MGVFTIATLKKIWIFLCVVLLILGGFFASHYAFFCAQTKELQLLQEHYQEHIDVLKRVIADVLVSGDSTVRAVPSKNTNKQKQLYQSLRSYLQQKDTNIDVQDLQELYRSFDSSIELKNNEKELVVALADERSAPIVVPSVRPASAKKKLARKKHIFSWPLERSRFWISSFFGRRKIARGKWTFHSGLDMAAIKGTPIKAAGTGRVIEAGDSSNGYGNTIVLAHENGYKTRYAHLERILVRYGHSVQRGQIIATVGDTGNVRGNGTDASHLHFEVYRYNKPVNPLYYLA